MNFPEFVHEKLGLAQHFSHRLELRRLRQIQQALVVIFQRGHVVQILDDLVDEATADVLADLLLA